MLLGTFVLPTEFVPTPTAIFTWLRSLSPLLLKQGLYPQIVIPSRSSPARNPHTGPNLTSSVLTVLKILLREYKKNREIADQQPKRTRVHILAVMLKTVGRFNESVTALTEILQGYIQLTFTKR